MFCLGFCAFLAWDQFVYFVLLVYFFFFFVFSFELSAPVQVIAGKTRPQNDLLCVKWDIKHIIDIKHLLTSADAVKISELLDIHHYFHCRHIL